MPSALVRDEAYRNLQKARLRELATAVMNGKTELARELAIAVLHFVPPPCVDCARETGVLCFVDAGGQFAVNERDPHGAWVCDPCVDRRRAAVVPLKIPPGIPVRGGVSLPVNGKPVPLNRPTST